MWVGALVLGLCGLPLAAAAQQSAQITPNYKDADIGQVIDRVVPRLTGYARVEDGKKNFAGSFVPPFAVINDAEFLDSLSDRDRRCGIAEV